MRRIKEDITHTIEIEKSKFITYLHKCSREEEAKAFITQIKKMHPNATHHCQAFVLGEHGELTRSNDDGEPSGTAGIPMLECLKKNEISDCVAVVVRYFGGVKLGAGGLIRAYSKSISQTLQQGTLVEAIAFPYYRLRFEYALIGKIDYLLSNSEVYEWEKEYEECVEYRYCSLDATIAPALQELSNGTLVPEQLEVRILEIKQGVQMPD
ncbi:MAG: YigZ family protein [Erysipelotrichaceae bacterium]